MLDSQPMVSVIMPIYRVEAYVQRAVESVFAQTYQRIQLILVDDCGGDNSMRIVRNLLDRAPENIDSKIVVHETNQGLSVARNSGMKEADGKYIFFMDSDDILPVDALQLLCEVAMEKDIPVVCGEFVRFCNEEEIDLRGGERADRQPVTIWRGTHDILAVYISNGWPVIAPNKLYERRWLEAHNMSFRPGIVHEDQIWSFQLICQLPAMARLNKTTYFYRINQNSITGSFGKKNVESWRIVSDFLYETISTMPEKLKLFSWSLNKEHTLFANAMKYETPQEQDELLTRLRVHQYRIGELVNRNIPWNRKFIYCLLHRGPRWSVKIFYRLFYKH